jgi:hypothetical protein
MRQYEGSILNAYLHANPSCSCSRYCTGFNRSRCVTLAPKPTGESVSLTHILTGCRQACAPPRTIAQNMLDLLAIRRPQARKVDHFLTRSRRLAAASHSASRTATLIECQSALKLGSDAILVQPISLGAYQPGLKQIDFAAAVHLPFNEFEAGNLPLGLSVGHRAK